MFKQIRKKINEIDRNAAEALLQSNRRGILAMNGDNGYLMLFLLIIFMIVQGKKFTFMELKRVTKWMH